jgi:hypothetical protein
MLAQDPGAKKAGVSYQRLGNTGNVPLAMSLARKPPLYSRSAGVFFPGSAPGAGLLICISWYETSGLTEGEEEESRSWQCH